MRYKLLGLAVILLISTPSDILAQKMSPIIIETGKPVPSVVRSGEPFRITYRTRYTDVVLIIEEQMKFDTLALVADSERKLKTENLITGDVEVISLEIGEKFRDGNDERGFVNIQDFTYTFMIINEEKGRYKIPSFDFIWVKKSAGTTVAKAKEKEELKKFPTKEVGISYVTSIVKPPPLDIRDGTRFETFKTLAYWLLMAVYVVIGLAFLSASIILVRFFHQLKSKETDKSKETADDNQNAVADMVTLILSPRKARRMLLKRLKALKNKTSTANDNEANRKIVAELHYLVRLLLFAELSKKDIKVSDSDTPKQISQEFLNLNPKQKKRFGRKYGKILLLTFRSRSYYQALESGSQPFSLFTEFDELRKNVEGLSLWWEKLLRNVFSFGSRLIRKRRPA